MQSLRTISRPAVSRLAIASFGLVLSVHVSTLAFECDGVTPIPGTGITLELVSSSLSEPVDVTAPPGDTERLFVVEQDGRIRIIDLTNDSLLPSPFLDISTRVRPGGERGLLGLAFHPDYATNGYFFVYYTRPAGAVCTSSPVPGTGCSTNRDAESVVSRFQVSGGNPNAADAGSEKVLLAFCQPFGNHNGGQVRFGPNDGYLYISTGDGGSANDPCGSGQIVNTFLGKLLRIDVDVEDPETYAIPETNPYVGMAGAHPEIWALGLRNPWRFSFDPANGDLYIGDVGQGLWEEIDYQPAGSSGGENYEWKVREGLHNFQSVAWGPGDRKSPIYEYAHGSTRTTGRSVTGGVVYRGCSMPDLHGRYFFADYNNNWVKSFRVEGGAMVDLRDHTEDLNAGITGDLVDDISAFGVDGRGEMYICDLATKLFRVVSTGPQLPEFQRGDTNADDDLDLSDGVRTLVYLFVAGPVPSCLDAADADNSNDVGLADAVYTFNYLFSSGPAIAEPVACGPDTDEDELTCESYPPCN